MAGFQNQKSTSGTSQKSTSGTGYKTDTTIARGITKETQSYFADYEASSEVIG